MKVEIRANKVIIDGYVNVTGRKSRPLTDKDGNIFVEEIRAGVFNRALKKNADVKILLNHNKYRELGSTKTNLTLKEDVIGLRATAEITDSEVIENAKQGKLRGWSFGFTNPKQTTSEINGKSLRSITDLDLIEVSLINDKMLPCYESTTVETRANQDIEIRALYDICEIRQNFDYSKYYDEIKRLRGNK